MFLKKLFDKNYSPSNIIKSKKIEEATKVDINIINKLTSKDIQYSQDDLYDILSSKTKKYPYMKSYNLDKKISLLQSISKLDLLECSSYHLENDNKTTIKAKVPEQFTRLEQSKEMRYKNIIESNPNRTNPCSYYFNGESCINLYLPTKTKKRKRNPNVKLSKIKDYQGYLKSKSNEFESSIQLASKDLKYNKKLESIVLDIDNDNTINLCKIDENKNIIPCIYPKRFNRINKAAILGII
jgi:hypothetical protein